MGSFVRSANTCRVPTPGIHNASTEALYPDPRLCACLHTFSHTRPRGSDCTHSCTCTCTPKHPTTTYRHMEWAGHTLPRLGSFGIGRSVEGQTPNIDLGSTGRSGTSSFLRWLQESWQSNSSNCPPLLTDLGPPGNF